MFSMVFLLFQEDDNCFCSSFDKLAALKKRLVVCFIIGSIIRFAEMNRFKFLMEEQGIARIQIDVHPIK